MPTDDQLLLMDELVDEMDLDGCGEEDEEGWVFAEFSMKLSVCVALKKKGDMNAVDRNKYVWYDPANSYNPAIHRLKDAVYHQATSIDLNSEPLPPPHPALCKFLDPPDIIVQRSEETVLKLKEELDIKAVPPPFKKGEGRGSGRQGESDT